MLRFRYENSPYDTDALLGTLLLDENGKVDVRKLRPICYASEVREYFALGQSVGKAFSDGLKLKNS